MASELPAVSRWDCRRGVGSVRPRLTQKEVPQPQRVTPNQHKLLRCRALHQFVRQPLDTADRQQRSGPLRIPYQHASGKPCTSLNPALKLVPPVLLAGRCGPVRWAIGCQEAVPPKQRRTGFCDASNEVPYAEFNRRCQVGIKGVSGEVCLWATAWSPLASN